MQKLHQQHPCKEKARKVSCSKTGQASIVTFSFCLSACAVCERRSSLLKTRTRGPTPIFHVVCRLCRRHSKNLRNKTSGSFFAFEKFCDFFCRLIYGERSHDSPIPNAWAVPCIFIQYLLEYTSSAMNKLLKYLNIMESFVLLCDFSP